MSELLGFKYTVNDFFSGTTNIEHNIITNRTQYITYIILSIEDGKYYIDMYSKGSIRRYDITGKTNDFCETIEKIGLKDWDRQVFPEYMDFFPHPPIWQLEVHTDKISMTCTGDLCCIYPHGWNEFKAAFEMMCGEKIFL